MDDPNQPRGGAGERMDSNAGDKPPSPVRRATMTEVALAAEVSQTTVSLVLNEVRGARFSAETRRRVLDAARRLNYNVGHRKLAATGTTPGTIAFVVDELSTDPWMALAMDGVREKSWEHGISICASTTGGDDEIEQAVLRQILAQPLVGLIYGAINTRRIERLNLSRDVPTMLLNCYLADHSLPSVVPSEVIGGELATRRLTTAGHRRIGFINGEPWMDASRDRLKGYRRALAEAHLAFDPELVRNGNWEPSAGYEQTLALLALVTPPTAIFCGNDIMALGCYDALKERGLAIPADVAVIGYDNREIAQYMHPPLTTVVLPHYDMGVEAATYLIDAAAHPKGRSTQIKVEGRVVERQSV